MGIFPQYFRRAARVLKLSPPSDHLYRSVHTDHTVTAYFDVDRQFARLPAFQFLSHTDPASPNSLASNHVFTYKITFSLAHTTPSLSLRHHPMPLSTVSNTNPTTIDRNLNTQIDHTSAHTHWADNYIASPCRNIMRVDGS